MHPKHQYMTLPIINQQLDEHSDIVMAKAAVVVATSGFNSFLLKPDGISCDSLFRYIVLKRFFDPKVCDHRTSAYLGIDFNVNKIGELWPSVKVFTKQHIINFSSGNGATMKLAKRKLEIMGYIKSFLGVHNDPDRLRLLTKKLELAHSLD